MLRLSELYTSIQGEGPNTGLPTQFVRFAGCNLRCPGWPCDTPHAIEPSIWRHEAQRLLPIELVKQLKPWPMSLTLTGGEPFIQPEEELREFVHLATKEGYRIEVFTNGTKLIPPWAYGALQAINLDYKLRGSGEELSGIEDGNRHDNVASLHGPRILNVKFVVMNTEDLIEAKEVYEDYYNPEVDVEGGRQYWVGRAWSDQAVRDSEIVDFVLEHNLPWRLNVQVHKYVWPASKRGV